MTEDERKAHHVIDCARNNRQHVQAFDELVVLAERLLAENSQLRVRDSNVTMHSLNVMAVNEDLQGRRCGSCKHWNSPQSVTSGYRDHGGCVMLTSSLSFDHPDGPPNSAETHKDFSCALWEKKS